VKVENRRRKLKKNINMKINVKKEERKGMIKK
jgi:hypothetical protein